MTMNRLALALILSLALNAGVIASVAYTAFAQGQWPSIFRSDTEGVNLPAYLELDSEQRRQWNELETVFLRELQNEWQQIRVHRERLINEIFSEQPDRERIESERAAIARLQSAQQRRTIEQLLRERDMLNPAQRRKLADLLSRQAPASTFEQGLHGK